jgi:CheY-like chemotaxis protein/HPt (histidine-containing phosphotransfer) domain-containing protein
MRNLLTFGRASAASVPAIVAPAGRPKTILIIDGRPDSLQAMRLALAGEPYRIETADTARSANRSVSAGHPDLILVDSRVVAEDGTRLAHRLLADEELASIPIIAVTAMVTGAHGVREAAGAFDGHIRKPIDAGTFAAQIRGFLQASVREKADSKVELEFPDGAAFNRGMDAGKLLDAIARRLPDSQFAPDTRTGLQRVAGVETGLQHYELAGYLRRAERLSSATTVRARSRFRLIVSLCREITERDADSVPEMAQLRVGYLDRRRAELSTLELAVREGDFAAIRKAGHNLKGTGAAYGYEEITEIGRSLETAGNDGNASAIEVLLEQIDWYIGIVGRPANTEEIGAAGI